MAPRHLGLVQQARGSTSAGAGGTGGHPCGSSLNKRLAGGAPQTRLHGGPGRAKREPSASACEPQGRARGSYGKVRLSYRGEVGGGALVV